MEKVFVLLLSCLLVFPAVAEERGSKLSQELEAALKKSGAPAMTVVAFNETDLLGSAHAGVKKQGSDEKVGPQDLWHIGSDTKAMTAVLVARLVEQGKLSWDSSMAGIFGDAAEEFHPVAAKITVKQLLSHTSGLKADPSLQKRIAAYQLGHKKIRKQRREILRDTLVAKPETPPGSQFLYSNLGYIVVGAVIEEVTSVSWEKAIAQEVFLPLDMEEFGFGSPPKRNPWGHRNGQAMEPNLTADNAPIYGPAGSVHLSTSDWVKFLQDQLAGIQGRGKLLKKESYQLLHTPIKNNYALGWIVQGGGVGHDGSNTMWYASVVLRPKEGKGVFAIANSADPKVAPAMREVMKFALSQ